MKSILNSQQNIKFQRHLHLTSLFKSTNCVKSILIFLKSKQSSGLVLRELSKQLKQVKKRNKIWVNDFILSLLLISLNNLTGKSQIFNKKIT
jgi:hypothetical protein